MLKQANYITVIGYRAAGVMLCIAGLLNLQIDLDHAVNESCAFIRCVSASKLDSPEIFKVGFTAPFNKVYFEEPYNFRGTMSDAAEIYMARNEHEAVQMVVFPERDAKGISVSVSDLMHTISDAVIPVK